MTDPPTYTARLVFPTYVGCWQLNDSFRISLTKKPNAFHRFMTTLLLGWEWIDNG
jgi:hypothetical protein